MAKQAKRLLRRGLIQLRFLRSKPVPMKLIALMCVRNEDWILGASLPALLKWVDEVILLDHFSTDRTHDLIAEVQRKDPSRTHIIAADTRIWNETAFRQKLLATGRARKGTHFAVIDADEILTANLVRSLRDQASRLKPGQGMMLPWISVWKGVRSYRDDGTRWSDWQIPVVFADNEGVAHQDERAGYFMHSRIPAGVTFLPSLRFQESGGLLHYAFSSKRRFFAKQAWYKMNEIRLFPFRKIAEINREYSQTSPAYTPPLSQIPSAWYEGYEGLIGAIDADSVSWHELECRRLWKQYGPEKFEGVDLYGLAGDDGRLA